MTIHLSSSLLSNVVGMEKGELECLRCNFSHACLQSSYSDSISAGERQPSMEMHALHGPSFYWHINQQMEKLCFDRSCCHAALRSWPASGMHFAASLLVDHVFVSGGNHGRQYFWRGVAPIEGPCMMCIETCPAGRATHVSRILNIFKTISRVSHPACVGRV